jgi:hypothetical protein
LSSARPLLRNNIIAWNFGEGIRCESSSAPQILHCTIAYNDVNGVVSSGASPTITNCILWENGDDLSGCSATYSIVQDGDMGTGNMPYAPHFVNALTDDFRLWNWSFAINAGDPTYLGQPGETDFAGNERVQRGRVDMGAYESASQSADTDGDGLADDWEMHYLGSLAQEAADDPEMDGISNLGEYLFGRGGDRQLLRRIQQPDSAHSHRRRAPVGRV